MCPILQSRDGREYTWLHTTSTLGLQAQPCYNTHTAFILSRLPLTATMPREGAWDSSRQAYRGLGESKSVPAEKGMAAFFRPAGAKCAERGDLVVIRLTCSSA